MPGRAASLLDARIGEAIETLVRSHHRRRLARIDRLEQLEPPLDGSLWSAGDAPPREGSRLEVLIDGAQALPALARAIESARSHVHLAGWHMQPDFGLTRDSNSEPLRDLLGEAAQRVEVRVLQWAGAPIPLFKPDRREVRSARERLVRGTRIRCALDSMERPLHCHHEKILVVDDERAFVGGIDMTALAGDRFDSSAHPFRQGIGWHDAGTRLEGPAVADVAEHFRARWGEVTGESLGAPAAPAAAGEHRLQVVRTVPEKVYGFAPRGHFGILEAYRRALRSAQRLIYLESQFLWSTEIVEILAAKLREPPSEEFRLVVVLPQRPNNGRDTTRGQLGELAAADQQGGTRRFLATTLCSRSGRVSGHLYVHAKVAIVDDEWLTIGSANLNDHSLFNDTEMNVVCSDPELARDTRLRLWAEHLERDRAEVEGPPARIVDELWRPIAVEQLARRRRGEAPTHRLLELPGVSRRSMALLGPLDQLLVDG